MKKSIYAIVVLFATIFLTTKTFAQGHFGVKGGASLTNLHAEGEKGDALIGYQAGIVYYSNSEIPLYFQTGLLYNTKGTKVSLFSEDIKTVFGFLEVPLNIGYKIPVGESFAISPFIGAFAGYALTGKGKFAGESINLFDKDLLEEGETLPKRFDFGGNVGLGLHLGERVIVTGQYSHGLGNLNDGDPKLTTRATTLGLTFLF